MSLHYDEELRRSPTRLDPPPALERSGISELDLESQTLPAGEAARGLAGREPIGRNDPLFFLAEPQPDGTYQITLTQEGLWTFETALGIARDLGGKTRISTYSTVQDIMERTATREELSEVMRQDRKSRTRSCRMAVLRRQVRGGEHPSRASKLIGHIGKIVVVGLLLFWALMQFSTAIGDIMVIPGILAHIPVDLLHLDPAAPVSHVQDRIADAGTHVVYGVLGVCLTCVVAMLIKPFARIYRYDQIIPGERLFLGWLAALLRQASR